MVIVAVGCVCVFGATGWVCKTHYPLEAIDLEALLPEVWLSLLQPTGRQKLSSPTPTWQHCSWIFLSSSSVCTSIFHRPPFSFSVSLVLPLTHCRSVSSMFSPVVVLQRTTVLSLSSVTEPLHILCMLYRQPNGGNQHTQMWLDSVSHCIPISSFY